MSNVAQSLRNSSRFEESFVYAGCERILSKRGLVKCSREFLQLRAALLKKGMIYSPSHEAALYARFRRAADFDIRKTADDYLRLYADAAARSREK